MHGWVRETSVYNKHQFTLRTCHLSDSLTAEHDLCWQPEKCSDTCGSAQWIEAVRFVFHQLTLPTCYFPSFNRGSSKEG